MNPQPKQDSYNSQNSRFLKTLPPTHPTANKKYPISKGAKVDTSIFNRESGEFFWLAQRAFILQPKVGEATLGMR